MSSLSVEIRNLAEVQDYINQVPEEEFTQAKTAFQEAAFAADKEVKGNTRNKLHVRTGMLRRSIRASVSGTDLGNLKASIFSVSVVDGQPVIYAPIHEKGGTVRAIDKYKRVPGGPYLNIPARANKTAAGVMRMPAREVFQRGGYIRRINGAKAKWGVFMDGKMMFSLVKEVKIPARLGMVKAAEGQIPTLLSKLKDLA